MYGDIKVYFQENVLTSYTEFIKILNNDSAGLSKHLRTAINIATVLYHLREHLPEGHKKTRKEVATACPDYDLLADIVNVSKHGELTRGNPQIKKAENIFEQRVLTRYEDDKGEYFGSESTIQVKLTNGTHRNICNVLTNVLNHWCFQFHSLGVISNPITFPYNTPNYPLTREQVAEQNADISMIQGVPRKLHMKLQEYNYETGNVEPTDLTGCEVKMTVYKAPRHIPVLNILCKETGEEFSKEIDLDDEEYAYFESLETENEKQGYILDIANKNGIIEELVLKAKTEE